MNNILNLKETLLKRNLVEDNKYLELYLQLLKINLNNNIGIKHHVIPVATYPAPDWSNKMYRLFGSSRRREQEKLANKDLQNFLVKLSKNDHQLAHAYLYLAGCQVCFMCERDALNYIEKYKVSNLKEN